MQVLGKLMPLFCAAFGLYFAAMGYFKYHIWEQGPRGGFLPMVMGLFVAGLSLAVFFKSRRPAPEGEQEEVRVKPFDWMALLPPAVVLGAILASYIIGMLPAVGLMAFGWLAFLEKIKPMKSLIISSILLLMVWLIFAMWLRVPFPTGIFEY